jgi:phosphoribosylformylglycinamidine synthase
LGFEEYFPVQNENAEHDPMLQRMYKGLDQTVFTVKHEPEPIKHVADLEKFNEEEGLALSPEEIEYLHTIEQQNGRPLTDSEIFGFAQINSEHCRHKIFGGVFVIDGEERESSLLPSSRRPTRRTPVRYCRPTKTMCAFAQGPSSSILPRRPEYERLFPGEAHRECHLAEGRDPQLPHHGGALQRCRHRTAVRYATAWAGGVGSWPIAGTAVYMTSYPRLSNSSLAATGEGNVATPSERAWEKDIKPRPWLYQSPEQILYQGLERGAPTSAISSTAAHRRLGAHL